MNPYSCEQEDYHHSEMSDESRVPSMHNDGGRQNRINLNNFRDPRYDNNMIPRGEAGH